MPIRRKTRKIASGEATCNNCGSKYVVDFWWSDGKDNTYQIVSRVCYGCGKDRLVKVKETVGDNA